jgi:TPR repeat protein
MDKYKTSQLGQALKKVYRGEISIFDSVKMAQDEIAEVFKNDPNQGTGFYGDKVGECPLCGSDVIRGVYNYGCSAYSKDSKGCSFLGYIYEKGIGVKVDYAQAKNYYKKSCTYLYDANGYGCTRLGNLYYNGLGVKQNYKQAHKYFQKASSKKYGEAEYNLGVLYYLGNGVDSSYEKARIHFERACEFNNAKGCYNLAGFYYHGYGVKADYKTAKDYLDKACTLKDERSCKAASYLSKL